MVEKRGRPAQEFTKEEESQALVALAGNEGNMARTARETQFTAYQLQRIRKNNTELYEAIRKQIADDIFDKTLLMATKYGDEILRRIDDEDAMREMKTKELAVVMGISIDKINVMSTVKGKFGDTQRAAETYAEATEEELAQILDAEYTEIKEADNEGMSGASKDGLSNRPKRISTAWDFLHSGGDKEP